MDCFADVAHISTFNKNTGTITTQFPNTDDFLDCMEQERGSDDDYASDKSPSGTSCLKSTFDISEDAKVSLASALDDPDMELAANLHASAKSRRTNFSCSTGNSTNRSVNTKQFALTHKSRTLALAQEVKKSDEMEHKNKALATQIKELEEMLSRGSPFGVSPPPQQMHQYHDKAYPLLMIR
jgi:hypothetical protein